MTADNIIFILSIIFLCIGILPFIPGLAIIVSPIII